jgi:hypothetical protein
MISCWHGVGAAPALKSSFGEGGFDVVGVQVEIARYTDDSQPGWVECQLTDIHGCRWSFIEKVPIVTLAWLDAGSSYPQPGIIACEVIDRRQDDGREVVAINTERPWHVEATSGETRFEVSPEQMVEFDWTQAAQ